MRLIITQNYADAAMRGGAPQSHEPAVTTTGKEDVVVNNKSGLREALRGIVEGVMGKAKEAAGDLTGDGDLTQEGQARQDKAQAQRDAATKEAEAEAARFAAAVSEKREQRHR